MGWRKTHSESCKSLPKVFSSATQSLDAPGLCERFNVKVASYLVVFVQLGDLASLVGSLEAPGIDFPFNAVDAFGFAEISKIPISRFLII